MLGFNKDMFNHTLNELRDTQQQYRELIKQQLEELIKLDKVENALNELT